MGIVRLRERKSTECHEAKTTGEVEADDPAASDEPARCKIPTCEVAGQALH